MLGVAQVLAGRGHEGTVVADGASNVVMRRSSALATAVTLGVLAATVVVVVTGGGRVLACSCAELTDRQAFESADTVFTGALLGTELGSDAGPVYSTGDPERFFFDVDKVFKGDATSRQTILTARDGASCGLEIGGRGPFVVFAYRQGDDIVGGAVDGELHSDLCSGTRAVSAGDLPASFGEGRSPEPSKSTDTQARLDDAIAVWLVALVLAATGLLGARS